MKLSFCIVFRGTLRVLYQLRLTARKKVKPKYYILKFTLITSYLCFLYYDPFLFQHPGHTTWKNAIRQTDQSYTLCAKFVVKRKYKYKQPDISGPTHPSF